MGQERTQRAHVLVFPFPSQGHINPMLQFAKRLASKGLEVSLVTTVFLTKSMEEAQTGSVKTQKISDGYDEGWEQQGVDFNDYLERFQSVGSESLCSLIQMHESSENPVSCLIYDAFLPWVLEVAKGQGVYAGAFFTQSCAVDAIYYNIYQKKLAVPLEVTTVSLPGLPEFQPDELPSFVYTPDRYPTVLDFVLNQYINLDKADWVLCNTFDELEGEVVSWMKKVWNVKTVGPTVPSMYVDKRVAGDNDYGLSLWKKESTTCREWLDARSEGSVVYASFGSLSNLSPEQMEEIALGLMESGHHFLWVVRASEEGKLPARFSEEASATRGLIVKWCPQLEVLAHRAVGCFVTHCGWNSTLEAVSLGVPMVGAPLWSDQPTNVKYVEEVWGVGVRARADGDKGMVRREEVKRCVMDVMEGERGKEMRKNAVKWKELARLAMEEGGSSDKNIDEFVVAIVG